MRFISWLIPATFLFFAALPASAPAQGLATIHGDLILTGASLRETPPAAPAAGGYLAIANIGAEPDRLLGASIGADVARAVELHEMSMQGDVMRMRPVEGGTISIPASETVLLRPGGLHLMLIGLAAPLVAGDTHEIILEFENAGLVSLPFVVRDMGAVSDIMDGVSEAASDTADAVMEDTSEAADTGGPRGNQGHRGNGLKLGHGHAPGQNKERK